MACKLVAAGCGFSVFVTSDEKVLACGRSREGQCGAFDGEQLRAPRQITGFPAGMSVQKVCCGEQFSLLLTTTGLV